MAKRKFPGIQGREENGAVRWRGRFVRDQRQHVGKWHDSQEAAHRDYLELRAKHGVEDGLNHGTLTLAEGLARSRARAESDRVSLYTLRTTYDAVHRVLLGYFSPAAPLRNMQPRDVEGFIKDRLDAGISANSITTKYLQLLSRAFTCSGLASPVAQVKKPKVRKPKTHAFTANEAVALLYRIRHEEFKEKDTDRVLKLRSREHDADLIELMLYTGIRSFELSRVSLKDVDLEGRTIYVRTPKVAGLEREVRIIPELVGTVRRLVDWSLKQGHHNLTGGNPLLVSTVTSTWQRRLAEPRLNARTLRHTAITLSIDAGLSLNDAMHFAGHLHATTTARYVEARKSRLGATAQAVGDLLKQADDARKAAGRPARSS